MSLANAIELHSDVEHELMICNLTVYLEFYMVSVPHRHNVRVYPRNPGACAGALTSASAILKAARATPAILNRRHIRESRHLQAPVATLLRLPI
jgi:hypothetical protein